MPRATLEQLGELVSTLHCIGDGYSVEVQQQAQLLTHEFLAILDPMLSTRLVHRPRQDSLRELPRSLERPERATMLEAFTQADQRAIKGALDEFAGYELLRPANRFDVKQRLLQEGHADTVAAERYRMRFQRWGIEADMARRQASRSDALRSRMADPGAKFARCGEHADLMMGSLERRGTPRERLLKVAKVHGNADPAVVLVSAAAPFDDCQVVPTNGALVIDTWALEPSKLAWVASDGELERHLGQVLRQVDPTLAGPGQRVTRA